MENTITIGSYNSFKYAEDIPKWLDLGRYKVEFEPDHERYEIVVYSDDKKLSMRKSDNMKKEVHMLTIPHIITCYETYVGKIQHDCMQCNKRNLEQWILAVNEILGVMNARISSLENEESSDSEVTTIREEDESISSEE